MAGRRHATVRVLAGPNAQESRQELEALMRVGREKRTRWLNDKLLRDMAVSAENQALWDMFRSIDFDKQSRVLERWEAHVKSASAPARPSAALVALQAWAGIKRKARDALKRAPPSLVDEIELRVLQFLEQGDCGELVLQLDDGFQRLLAHGLAEFHGLTSASRPAPPSFSSPEPQQAEEVAERFREAKRTLKLNLGYAALVALPEGFTDLELAGNQIAELDEVVLSSLERVRDLDLSGNALAALGDGLAAMPALAALALEHNCLEALPESLGGCGALVRLDVSHNQLRQLPESLARLPKLQRLLAANNQLLSVPLAFGHMRHLKEVNLGYNPLEAPLAAKAAEGLSRLLAHLREEDERLAAAALEALKPVGFQVAPHLQVTWDVAK
ncbi:hypothetical protein WJX81_004685 [Elliptochloris bilobata]|uniref:Uncharacterized protein n=1 Tax=Elliptochloris bilobata TaxID=381761 RepID=A0AAW1SHY2_9CHLO